MAKIYDTFMQEQAEMKSDRVDWRKSYYEEAEKANALAARLAEARRLIEYAYDELGGAWPEADAFLADKGDSHE